MLYICGMNEKELFLEFLFLLSVFSPEKDIGNNALPPRI